MIKVALGIFVKESSRLGWGAAGMIAGAVPGAVIGAMRDPEHRVRNAAIGASIGGALGIAPSLYVGKNINKWLIRDPALREIKRRKGAVSEVVNELGEQAWGHLDKRLGQLAKEQLPEGVRVPLKEEVSRLAQGQGTNFNLFKQKVDEEKLRFAKEIMRRQIRAPADFAKGKLEYPSVSQLREMVHLRRRNGLIAQNKALFDKHLGTIMAGRSRVLGDDAMMAASGHLVEQANWLTPGPNRTDKLNQLYDTLAKVRAQR